jgi:pilus assembly protein Flp/PilA
MSQLIALLHQAIARFEHDDEGATAVEYGLMVALIAAVVIVGATALGVNANAVFNSVAGSITAA